VLIKRLSYSPCKEDWLSHAKYNCISIPGSSEILFKNFPLDPTFNFGPSIWNQWPWNLNLIPMHHWRWEFESRSWWNVLVRLCDKVCRWFSPVSSTNKTDHHDITEILLKVACDTITPDPKFETKTWIFTSKSWNCIVKYNYISIDGSWGYMGFCTIVAYANFGPQGSDPRDTGVFICASLNLCIKIMTHVIYACITTSGS